MDTLEIHIETYPLLFHGCLLFYNVGTEGTVIHLTVPSYYT